MASVNTIRGHKGFTLVEVLVVMVIMGLVMTAVYGVYINVNRTGNTSEEVVDVQQNLRVAMEMMVEDIRMAGFLVPSSTTAIANAPVNIWMDKNGDGAIDAGEGDGSFTLQTSSASKASARILSEDTTTSPPEVIWGVSTGMASRFSNGEIIHIIRPTTLNDLTPNPAWNDTLRTITVNPGADTISVTNAGYSAGTIEPGDMIVRKLPGEATPTAVINYWLSQNPTGGTNNFDLMRSDGNSSSVVASNINTLTLTYLQSDGTAATGLDDIAAIRINISAQTDNTKTGLASYSGVKTRSLQTVVKIHN